MEINRRAAKIRRENHASTVPALIEMRVSKTADFQRHFPSKRSSPSVPHDTAFSMRLCGLCVSALISPSLVGLLFRSLAILFLAQIPSLIAAATVSDLRCEYLENPLGIDTEQPRLSWVLHSSNRNQSQTAFRLLVASSQAKLNSNQGDLWDTGILHSDQSIQVRYAGAKLESHQDCFWKVRVWDDGGRASAWSQPAHWSIGLLKPEDWKAKWIGLGGEEKTNYIDGTDWIWFPEGEPDKSARPGTNYFRRVIVIPADREIKWAQFVYTGDNECRGWVNGRDVGARNSYHTVKDNDITYRLLPGTNILAFTGRNTGTSAKPAGVVGRLEVQFVQGEPLVIPTDSQWKVWDHELPGWNEAAFDDSDWPAAKDLGPVGMEPWGKVKTSEDRRLPARCLRKQFDVNKKVKRATVYFSGLGLSELYLNGSKVGDHVLSPGLTEYRKRVFYVTFDVTKQLKQGANAMGVVLGNGRFYATRSKVYAGTVSYGFPKLLLHLRLEFADGSLSEVVSDDSWNLSTDGPILANNEYDGEEYDARKEFSGWASAGFDDSHWQRAEVVSEPGGAVVSQMIEPIRVTAALKPVAVNEPKPGRFIFDLGQNMVGWCRLRVSGPAGTQVSLRFAETLKPDGTLYMDNLRGARVTDIYTLKGSGAEEIWEPRFTYHGFRYVEMSGFPGRPSLESLEGRVVHDDLESAGEFACSNPLLNHIYHNTVWGVSGNYRSIPTDCPQRDERQGWLGDRSEESLGETYLFDNCALYANWLHDMADSQRENGSVPDVSPAYWPIYSDNVTWPSSGVIIPSTLRRQFGDTAIIEQHYECARKWVNHMLDFVSNGIISKDSYGDWCMPPEDPKLIHSTDPNRITDKTLLATSYFYHDLCLMERYATMLGNTDDAARFGKLAGEIKTAFNNKFLNRELGQYDNGTQTSCVLPLAFGLVPEDQRSRIFAHLAAKITEESKGHIGTGLIGAQYLNRVLSDNGRADLAYTIATQRDYPSWGYMIEHGATTIWELWNGNTADPAMNSGNHVMLIGDLVIWFYEYLAGIRPDPEQPGFKHIILEPYPVGDLTFVRATHRSPYGLIASEWHKQEGKFDWKITIPANTTAEVYVPATEAKQVTEGGKPVSKAKGVEFLRMEDGRAVFRVGSGEYHFMST
jgi:alpha-L-rhamnosidase